MDHIVDVFTNYVLICGALGWIIAQVLKCVTGIIVGRRFNFTMLVSSGGMPSSHSATVCAIAAATAKTSGLGSVEFAIASVLAFIVMYDAAGVRWAAGEQARILNRIMRNIEEGKSSDMNKELKELIGHTPLEVIAGAALGVIIAVMLRVG